MEFKWTKQEKSTGELLVTVNGQEWKDAQAKAFKKLAKQIELPGFRKGQAPESILKKNIKDEQVYYEAVDNNATDWLFKGIEENNVEIIARPSLDIKAITADEVVLSFIITVTPDVKLGKYKDLKIKKDAVTVSDKDVDKRLKEMQERFAELTVKKGKVKKGDTAVIDFEGFKDGVAFEGGKGESYPLEIGSNSFIPGFEDQIIGMKAGEEKDIDVTFPEDYQVAELKGQPVVFKVKVNDVKEKVLPELNDDFAKEVEIKDVETLEQLRNHVLDDLTKEKEREVEFKFENDLMSEVVDKAEVEIPEVMISEEADQMYKEFESRMSQQGLSMDMYFQFSGQTKESLREQSLPEAEKRVKTRLVLSTIAKTEGLEPTAEEVEEEYKNIAEMYKMDIAKVKASIDETAIKYDLRNQKAYDFIKENIKK